MRKCSTHHLFLYKIRIEYIRVDLYVHINVTSNLSMTHTGLITDARSFFSFLSPPLFNRKLELHHCACVKCRAYSCISSAAARKSVEFENADLNIHDEDLQTNAFQRRRTFVKLTHSDNNSEMERSSWNCRFVIS